MSSSFGDLGSAVVIIFVFAILHGVLALSTGIANIRNNWEEYKCNPGIMPFANVFGHDVITNFNECIKITQVDFMSAFLQPVYQSLAYFAESGAVFAKMFENMKMFGNMQDMTMTNFVGDMRSRLLKMAEGSNEIFIGVIDTFSKLGSTITVLFYMVESAIQAMNSAWNEIPGTLIRIATLGSVS